MPAIGSWRRVVAYRLPQPSRCSPTARAVAVEALALRPVAHFSALAICGFGHLRAYPTSVRAATGFGSTSDASRALALFLSVAGAAMDWRPRSYPPLSRCCSRPFFIAN